MAEDTVHEIIDFAIAREQEAHDFYMDLAEGAERPTMKELFTQFAGEELGHKRKLEMVKAGNRQFPVAKGVMDLKISDYIVDVEVKGELTYQEALIVAMKREKAAFMMYTDLATLAGSDELKSVFLALAQEEAKHKLRFEIEYDDVILREN